MRKRELPVKEFLASQRRRPARAPRTRRRPILAGIRSPATDASPPLGPPPTATTNSSGSPCTSCSTTSASIPSVPPH